MATKSDFAQKLLQDLRMRKEKMSAPQNSSRQSSQTSKVMQGNPGQTSRGSRRINSLESTGSKIGITRTRSNGINMKESSNQMVLYKNQQTSKQIKDLSMAIAFAFENTANRKNINSSTASQLVDFVNRFGRKMEITTTSQIHITEISKGVQKLNQILQACSDNGFSFNRNSIEIGKELLKGSIDLEESLRMLVSFQESSQSTSGAHKTKSHLKLLDEDEDDQENNDKIADQWKLERPKFSFDKPSKKKRQLALSFREEENFSNSIMVPHKGSTSCVQDLIFTTRAKLNNSSGSSTSAKEKGRISNVVAKLMGLEELPLNQVSVSKKSDSNEKLSRKGNQKKATVTNDTPPNGNSKLQLNGFQNFVDSETKQNKIVECRTSANSMETRGAGKQKRPLIQEPVLKRAEHSKGQQLQKQNLPAKKDQDQQVESTIAPKSKKSTAYVHGNNGRSTKLTEKIPIKDPPKRRHHQDSVPIADVSQKTAASKKENFKKEDQSSTSYTRAPQFVQEKPIEISAPQKKANLTKVRRSEIPQKTDALMIARRNSTASQSTRTVKQPAAILRDLKQQMQNKNRSSRENEEQSNSKGNETKTGMIIYSESEKIIEPVNEQDKLRNEGGQSTQILNEKCDTIALDFEKVLNDLPTSEHHCALKDEQELEQCDQSLELDNIRSDKHKYKQLFRQEQLTEPEKELKEIVIKSQQFLSTSEALFKLNIPLSFLHATDNDEVVVVSDKKLVLDSAYEITKRKARRHEITYTKSAVSYYKVRSLDDLVRQLCRDLEMLRRYGGNGERDECGDVAASLYNMVCKDFCSECSDVNCMWDFEWSRMMCVVSEKEGVVGDVERHVFDGLVNEIVNDLVRVVVTVSG
ncbi:hypothetical protein ABFS82_14G045700 [Erythranthe guttata]